jgi:hypothetical protein
MATVVEAFPVLSISVFQFGQKIWAGDGQQLSFQFFIAERVVVMSKLDVVLVPREAGQNA